MIRKISGALAIVVATAAPAVAAPAAMPTVLVLPAEGDNRALGDIGDAVQLRLQGVLRAAGGTNVVHIKTYLRVMERYARRLTDLEPSKRHQTLGEIVGADVVVASVVRTEDKGVTIEIEAIPVMYQGLKGDATRGQSKGTSLLTALDAASQSFVTLLKGTGRVPAVEAPTKDRISPVTDSEDALLSYAACNRALMAQPLGLRSPIVIDQAVLFQSEDLCAQALEADPKLKDAHAELALIQALRGKQLEAEKQLRQAKDAKSFVSSYWIAKFWVLSRFYDVELALETLEQAIEVHPGFMLGRGYLGEALISLRRPDKGQKAFEDYLAASPRQSWVMGQIGYALAKQGKVDEAIEWTEKALKVAPGDPELLLQLASRFVDAGRNAEAVTLMRRVVSEGGARGEVHLRLGYAYLKLGKFNEAEREMQTAILKAEGTGEWRTRGRARYNLARLWIESGAPRNAVRQLRMAVQEGFKDKGALEHPSMAPLKSNEGYQELLAAKPPSGVAPQYISPLGRTSPSGELVVDPAADSKSDRKILGRF